ncbi:hypothetical protein DUNSADRAFT_7472 [Dunaliella salina]|uniref:Uncharacterized protein n=1 Tax=Dunaliella salina TaxID=3046 RepID=A0ABQ7GL97_DUNSA|nr:hypothetical protein DUNSADRAFT_7472 [Dunaliella salina]|eukprot:KAF5835387.1 hypothetical protein DUNSADRAFT_7472 [Dunaliella salina]
MMTIPGIGQDKQREFGVTEDMINEAAGNELEPECCSSVHPANFSVTTWDMRLGHAGYGCPKIWRACVKQKSVKFIGVPMPMPGFVPTSAWLDWCDMTRKTSANCLPRDCP